MSFDSVAIMASAISLLVGVGRAGALASAVVSFGIALLRPGFSVMAILLAILLIVHVVPAGALALALVSR